MLSEIDQQFIDSLVATAPAMAPVIKTWIMSLDFDGCLDTSESRRAFIAHLVQQVVKEPALERIMIYIGSLRQSVYIDYHNAWKHHNKDAQAADKRKQQDFFNHLDVNFDFSAQLTNILLTQELDVIRRFHVCMQEDDEEGMWCCFNGDNMYSADIEEDFIDDLKRVIEEQGIEIIEAFDALLQAPLTHDGISYDSCRVLSEAFIDELQAALLAAQSTVTVIFNPLLTCDVYNRLAPGTNLSEMDEARYQLWHMTGATEPVVVFDQEDKAVALTVQTSRATPVESDMPVSTIFVDCSKLAMQYLQVHDADNALALSVQDQSYRFIFVDNDLSIVCHLEESLRDNLVLLPERASYQWWQWQSRSPFASANVVGSILQGTGVMNPRFKEDLYLLSRTNIDSRNPVAVREALLSQLGLNTLDNWFAANMTAASSNANPSWQFAPLMVPRSEDQSMPFLASQGFGETFQFVNDELVMKALTPPAPRTKF